MMARGFDHLWHFFSSVRLAMILILLLTVGTLIGTLLQQAPSGLTPGSPDYTAWLQRLRPRFGVWTDPLSTLHLFSIFQSWWYRGLLAALAINTVVCSINRWPGISQAIFSPRVRMDPRFFQTANRATSVASPAEQPVLAYLLRRFLLSQRYRVLVDDEAGRIHLYADKHRFARLGTFLTHLSLVVMLAGGALGGLVGFSDKQFVVPEGTTRPVGFGTGLSVTAASFVDEYYPEGPPKDYRSDLILYHDGVEVRRQTIRVNEPLEYNGVRFYQSFFGPAVYLQIREPGGQLLYDDGVALAWRTQGERPVGSFTLPERNLTIYAVGPASGKRDTQIRPGEIQVEVYQGTARNPLLIDRLAQGQTKDLGGLQMTFTRERQFTGLQVSQAPATAVIWLASLMLILGLVINFYFPHRRLWAIVQASPTGGAELRLAATTRRDPMFGQEFERLADDVRVMVASLPVEREMTHV